jgi:uncharacterized protein (DUF1501 family)
VPQINRREFLMGCSAAIAAMSGSQLTSLALGANDSDDDTLVVVFLRGGMDVLTAFPPLGGDDREAYEAARPTLKVPVNSLKPLDGRIGMNAALEPLFELYKDGKFALVPATGMPSDTRSHFDAQEYMELGTPDKRTSTTGWLARMLETAPKPAQTVRLTDAFVASDEMPSSLRGDLEALAFPKLEDFNFGGDDAEFRKFLFNTYSRLWSGDTWLHSAGVNTLRALETVAKLQKGGGDAKYPDGDFAQSLKTVARVVKEGLGVRAATVDLGGWDTHKYQGEGGRGYIGDLFKELAGGLQAFYADLGAHATRVTVCVMSEFGRRLSENASYGTDHGHGSAMLVLGGSVNGGKVYGRFPGLQPDQLYDRADLNWTTDYRAVFAEVLTNRFKHTRIKEVFPDFAPGKPLGIVKS